jgi:hypothetical protein
MRARVGAIALFLCLCCPEIAHAQASANIPLAYSSPQSDSQPYLADPQAAGRQFEYKSPSTAFNLSLFSTLVPMAVGTIMVSQAGNSNSLAVAGAAGLVLGLSFGPTIGYAYSGEQLRGWGVGALRLAGLGVGFAAMIPAVASGLCDVGDAGCSRSGDAGAWAMLGVVSLTAVVVSAVYDIVTAPGAARRANERHGLTNLSLVPVPIAGRSSTSAGLALVGQF